MKLQALAAVLLVFLICPDFNGQAEAFSLSFFHDIISKVKEAAGSVEAHIKDLEGEVKADAQKVLAHVKATVQNEEAITLQELTKLLKEVNALVLKVHAEMTAYVAKLQKELEAATRALLLKYLTKLQDEVIQLQARVTTLEGTLKAEAQKLLAQAKIVLQKGTAITIEDLTKLQADIEALCDKHTGMIREIFKGLYNMIQNIINAKVQLLLSQIEGYLNKAQASALQFQGQVRERLLGLLSQLKTDIEKGQALSVQALTKIAAGLQELSPKVDQATAAIFKEIITRLQSIIKALQQPRQP